ncbi:MAG: phospholipid carrier-dependent glycosyltransferase, partial [Smithella sp.]
LLYGYLNKKSGQLAGLLGALIFISLPTILRTATTAYVDAGLVFFTTLSVLASLYWRDSEYKKIGWLLISAVAMGLALGTKYSALPAWLFLTLAIVFVYSKDTGGQGRALRHGLVFFLVSLLVFSPWLIKNIILTGNPLYPLYQGVFGAGGGNLSEAYQIVSTDAGMFKMRQMLYGDNFLETLLIPIRFFLQGQDHNPQYFDGVLNPVLIFIVPFAFMNRKMKTDKILLLASAVFFILLAFFMDKHRIRYILPSVPLVIILTVMGYVNILNWIMERPNRLRMAGLVAFAGALIGMIGFNAAYAKNYFIKIAPVNYILQKESRDDFIARHDGSYRAVQFINKQTPANSRIRLILLAGRGYYLDRSYDDDASFGMNVIQRMVSLSADEQEFQKYLRSLSCTHFLMRYDLFQKFLTDNYLPEEINQLMAQLNKSVTMIYRDDYYAVIGLK